MLGKQSEKRNQGSLSGKSVKNYNIPKRGKTNSKSKQFINKEPVSYFVIPVFIILSILPFIIRLKEYNTHLSQYEWFSSDDKNYDFFLYYKHWIFVIIAVAMACIIIYHIMQKREALRTPRIFIPIGIYALLALLSAILSKSAVFSFGGSIDEFESVFALLGYCITLIYTFYFIHEERDYQFLSKVIIVVALIFSFLGILQFAGIDILNTSFMRNLILPYKYSEMEMSMNFSKGTVFLTLFNPNYVGVYTSLVTPLLFIMLFFLKDKLWRLLSSIAAVGLIMCAIGARSLSGIIGLGTAVILILILMWRYLIKRFYITVPIVLCLVIGVVAINLIMHNYFGSKILNLFQNSKTNYEVTQMDTNADCVSLTYHGNSMKLQYMKNEDNSVSFIPTDSNGNVIQCTFDQTSNAYQLTDSRFSGIKLGLGDEEGKYFCIQTASKTWFFTNQTGDGQYYYVNAYGKPDKIVNAPSAIFTGYEGIASNRGYIWSRTIPLLKNNIILGSGPDTFLLDFPQQDYLYRSLAGFDTAIMTKPHSLYLQIAMQTGILSLIAFLVFYGMYFVSSIRLYIHGRFESYFAKAGLAVFIGSFAYMVTGLTNDSCIAVAPTFWVFMGLGIALNAKAKPMIQQEIEAYKETKRNSKKDNI